MGKPVPDTPHAVSVTLPTWEQVVGYEECDPAVLGAMETLYQRGKNDLLRDPQELRRAR